MRLLDLFKRKNNKKEKQNKIEYTTKQLKSEITESQEKNNRPITIDKANDFKEGLSLREHMDYIQEIKNQRKQNPSIELLSQYCEGEKKYFNCNGININTGDIIKIRKLKRIEKDENGTYLYSAYLKNTLNRNDTELLYSYENSIGSLVCFELGKRIEDIIKENDKEEINKLLELFSNVQYCSEDEDVIYIGAIDENNNIQRNNISSSQTIQIAIENFKKEHAKKEKNIEK